MAASERRAPPIRVTFVTRLAKGREALEVPRATATAVTSFAGASVADGEGVTDAVMDADGDSLRVTDADIEALLEALCDGLSDRDELSDRERVEVGDAICEADPDGVAACVGEPVGVDRCEDVPERVAVLTDESVDDCDWVARCDAVTDAVVDWLGLGDALAEDDGVPDTDGVPEGDIDAVAA